MPKKITQLTEEQKARMPEWVQKWIKIGLCCDPSDRKETEDAIRECYKLSSLKPPSTFTWVESPIVLSLAAPIAAVITEKKARVDLDDVVKSINVPDNIRVEIVSAVDRTCPDRERGKSEKGIVNTIKESIFANWHRYLGGQFWVGWQAYESFYDEVCNLEHEKLAHARAYRRAQSSCGWWWPHSEFCVVCDRPAHIQRDPAGRLHSEDSMSIKFRDGWGLWHINGVAVNEQIVNAPQTLTIEQINDEKNQEVRSIMIQRFTPERYLEESKADIVDMDYEGAREGKAPRMLLRDKNGDQWLCCTDSSSQRVFYPPVARTAKTCVEAHSGIAGFDESKIGIKS